MKILFEGDRLELVQFLSAFDPVPKVQKPDPCPCNDDLCTVEEADGIIDDLKEQVRNLSNEKWSLNEDKKRISEDLTTWKAAAANNYELYERTVKEKEGLEKEIREWGNSPALGEALGLLRETVSDFPYTMRVPDRIRAFLAKHPEPAPIE